MDGYKNGVYKFPFYLFAPKIKVLIFGWNDIGRDYYIQAKKYSYLDSIGIVDDKIEIVDEDVPLYDVDQLHLLVYDNILVATERKETAIKIKRMLIAHGVKDDIIVWDEIIYSWDAFLEKNYFLILRSLYADISYGLKLYSDAPSRMDLFDRCGERKAVSYSKKAYEYDCVSVAFMSYSGGLGDAIIAKKVYEVLPEMETSCRIDVYAKNGRNLGYAKAFYGTDGNLNGIFEQGEYEENYQKYDVAMRVWHRIEIDYVDKNKLKGRLAEAVEKIVSYNRKYRGDMDYNKCVLHNISLAHNSGKNRYTCLAYNGALPIYDCSVRISLLESKRFEFESLNLTKYITLNAGSGDDYDKVQLKEWPMEYFEELIKLIKEKFSEVKVVQIGAKGQGSIAGIDEGFLGRDLELVKYILKDSMLHIDCEGGLVHLATQLGTKCAVIFGPTDVKYYGYEGNINIVSDVCSPCIGKWRDRYTCMRGDGVPPRCMKSITPQMVFDKCQASISMGINM